MSHFLILCIIILLITILGELASDSIHSRVHRKCAFWSCIILFMIIGAFRDPSIGNDTEKYMYIYNEIQYDSSRYEIGFVLLNKFLYYISPNPRTLLVFSSIFIFYCYGRTIWKYSAYPWLSLYIIFSYTFFPFALSGIRESLAIGIILLSFDYLIQKKNLQYLILVVFATSLHTTAIIFALGLLFRNTSLTKRNILIMFACGGIAYIMFPRILSLAFSLLPYYAVYEGGEYFGETRLASMLDFAILFIILIFAYTIWSHSKTYVTNQSGRDNNRLMIILVVIATIIMLVSFNFNLLSRIALYFSFFASIILPNAISLLPVKKRSIITIASVICFTIYSLTLLYYRPEWNQIFPYKTYL